MVNCILKIGYLSVCIVARKNKGNGGARNTGLEYATETMFISWMQMIYCLKMLWIKMYGNISETIQI